MDRLTSVLLCLPVILLAYILPVPSVGSADPLGSYLHAFLFLLRGEEIVQRGYNLYNGTIFRIPCLPQWTFVASGPTLINDMCYSSEDSLSFQEAMRDQLQADWTLGPRDEPDHLVGVMTKLTRNLGQRFPDVYDEVVCAFDEALSLDAAEWKTIPVMASITDIVARISGRLFVGLPLCREPEYIEFTIKHTYHVVIARRLIGYVPKFLRPILGPLISSRKRHMRQATKLLGALVAERIRMFEESGGDWPDKPNDLVSWLLDVAQPHQRTTSEVIKRILIVIMAAIHTTSLTFVHALFDLAANPSCIQPLREEVEVVIGKQGWTKASLGDMDMIDSFIRESQRINGLVSLSMARKVIHPDGFKFSDGTTLPPGSFVQVPVRAVQHDPDLVSDPEVFDGFRFFNMRNDSEKFTQYMATTDPTHLVFGHGKHACPGRFFAATELKAMLAHVLLTYDIRFETGGTVRPTDQVFDGFRVPNSDAKLLFRKRQV
ncbi:cytochrome P450 [Mycena sanguinolenta]|nr:cytochrome P450 [Mycena sanguinolenta]